MLDLMNAAKNSGEGSPDCGDCFGWGSDKLNLHSKLGYAGQPSDARYRTRWLGGGMQTQKKVGSRAPNRPFSEVRQGVLRKHVR